MKKSILTLLISSFLIHSSGAEDHEKSAISPTKEVSKAVNDPTIKDDVWVSISYKFGYNTTEAITLLDKGVYNQIVTGKLNKGWLELRNVYWAVEGKLVPQVIAGKAWGYGNTSIIKVADIHRITPMSKESIRTLNKLKSE